MNGPINPSFEDPHGFVVFVGTGSASESTESSSGSARLKIAFGLLRVPFGEERNRRV